MGTELLKEALEREHREIDAGIEDFLDCGADAGDRAALQRAIGTLRRHIYAEEELLFPSLCNAGLAGPILVMLREHGQMWGSLDSLDHLLDSDPVSDEALPALCRRLCEQLQAHNSKEEAVIYPQANTALPVQAASDLQTFLDYGELPEGWICKYLQARS